MADNRAFIDGQKWYLAGSGCTASATTITLQSMKYPDNTTNVVTADIGALGRLTLEPSTVRQEVISFTTITQNANGTATLTGVTRGIAPKAPYTASSSYAYPHGGGSEAVFGNPASFYNDFANKENDETIAGTWTFTEATRPLLTADLDTAVNAELVTFGQLSRTSFAGTVDASTVQKGIVEMATAAETTAGTAIGGTGALLVIDPATLAAQVQSGTWISATEDGSGGDDTYTATLTPALTAYTANMLFAVKLTVANTGACTINLNGLGAKSIKKYASGAKADPETGDIVANMTCLFYYDGTDAVLLNPNASMPTTAILTEMATFFGSTDITGAEAETLTDNSNAVGLHYHKLNDLIEKTNTVATRGIVARIQSSNVTSSSSGGAFTATSGVVGDMSSGSTSGQFYIARCSSATILDWGDTQELVMQLALDATTQQDVVFGLGSDTTVPANATYTTRHAAFLVQDGTIYASVADGTTQDRGVALGTTLTNFNTFRIVFTPALVTFYVNGVSVATRASNIPTGASSYGPILMGIATTENVAKRIYTALPLGYFQGTPSP